jgi:hypothetical protein
MLEHNEQTRGGGRHKRHHAKLSLGRSEFFNCNDGRLDLFNAIRILAAFALLCAHVSALEDESDRGKPQVGKDEDPHIEDVRRNETILCRYYTKQLQGFCEKVECMITWR